MAKIVFFLIVIFIILFPVFVSNKKEKSVSVIVKNKPLIEIFDGKFKKYNKNLEINGSVVKTDIYKTYSEFKNLFANDLVKNEKYFAKWALRKNNIIKAKSVRYLNKDYLINSKNVIFFKNKKFLKGWDFNFSSNKARGKGKYFEIDKNKNLFAKNIIYFIKVEK